MENRPWRSILCDENGYELIIEKTEFSTNEEDVIELEVVEDKGKKLEVDNEKFVDILKRFVKSYIDKGDSKSLKDWLVLKLKEEFPQKDISQLELEAKELIKGVELGKEKYDLIKKKNELGLSSIDVLGKEIAKSTFGENVSEVKRKLKEESKNLEKKNISNIYNMTKDIEIAPNIMAFNKMNRYFDNINETIAKGNQKMVDSILTKSGNINQNPQLDGFIFEQFHENTFNIDAAIKDIQNIRGEVLVPKPGATYGKNSVDLVIKLKKDGVESTVRKYQAKLSDNPEALFKSGNYKFQRRLYGEGHENLGNTRIEYGEVKSTPVSKAEMKKIQNEVQKGNIDASKQSFEKNVDIKVISKQIAKQSLMAGTIGMGVGMAMSTGVKMIQGEELKAEEIILDGLKIGGSVGVSTAISGGIKTAVEKGVIKGTAAKILKNNNVVGTIAFSALSLVGVALSIGNGDISLKDGLKESGAILAGTYGGLAGVGITSGIMASVGVILTPVVAGVVGTIGYFVGSTVASNLTKGAISLAEGVANNVKNIARAGYETVKSVASGVWNGVKNIGSFVANGISTVCSGIASLFGW